MLNSYDIIILTLIIIIIGIIIVINVKKSLNNKLSNVEVKIPQINQPNVIVKIQKECDSDKFDVFIEKENDKKEKKTSIKLESKINQEEKKIEHFNNKSNEEDTEDTEDTAANDDVENTEDTEDIDANEDTEDADANDDTQDAEDTESMEDKDAKEKKRNEDVKIKKIITDIKGDSESKLKAELEKITKTGEKGKKGTKRKKKIDIEEGEVGRELNKKYWQHLNMYKDAYPNTFKFVKFPDADKTLDYDEHVCPIKKNMKYQLNKTKTSPWPSCTDPKQIKAYNLKKVKDILDKEPYDDDEEYDTLQYFLKMRQFVPTSFEDGVTRGGNIGEYGNYGGLDDIGKILIGKDNFDFAKPKNYMFSGFEISKDKK
jgi:hypothetical protein